MRRTGYILIVLIILIIAAGASAADLSLWRDGRTRTAILDFLEAVTDPAGEDFIPVPDRIAVFDNDGTFWCERPDYPANLFQTSLLKGYAARGEVDGSVMPFKAFLEYDRDALWKYGYKDAWKKMNKVFTGMTFSAFRDSARIFMDDSRHPEFGVSYYDLYYAPMLELTRLLESHDFKVWVVTGSEQDFMRSFIEMATGIPSERVIGSWTPGKMLEENGKILVVRGEAESNNGHEAKPVNIEARIGRRPVFAAGNSNNDQPMCRYSVTGQYRSLAIWIHHDDPEREFDYDRGTDRIADLVRENDNAFEVSIKRDWLTIFKEGIGR